MNSQKNYRRTLIKSSSISAVNVSLGKRSYPIYIGEQLLEMAGKYCRKHSIPRTVVIITDRNVGSLYLSPLEKNLRNEGFKTHSIVIPAGEKQKSIGRISDIFTRLLEWNIERDSAIIALGGGVIGDLAGFVAATYQRGVKFVQIPTSLLAQVDSSVGGKTGINHPRAKNMIGAFYQPAFVLADIGVLSTLPQREIICGLGEIIKYGIILDENFFTYSANHVGDALMKNKPTLFRMVKRSCELKAYVVSKDEREQNLRTILNFGHTVGHALEQAGKYSYLKHGEAVFYGMRAEAQIARSRSQISAVEFERITASIDNIPLPRLSGLTLRDSSLIKTMKMDKKGKDGAIRMVLPKKVGSVSLPVSVNRKEITAAFRYLKEK